ncbi:hypothetical protein HME9302_01777 [Alteripontixanthobacter maritimus]|uniref:HPr kinase/phosphorylase C-terminal domain-containing protein n=1 Tax=Alteripontixanthobacter maritimus TaxID=2161824 RepID=A0A369QBG5_9SPHN|nr:serine kinase [Alteripontixanthobacter maritimus]RDC60566.1 hypothetical protein HME9302_01777 [Alteripontixanthobacter maritimus]
MTGSSGFDNIADTGVLHQASCVSVAGRAILIEGPPGVGKTTLLLMLLDRGATLIGDDGVRLLRQDDVLWAAPAETTRGLVEIRNVGIATFETASAPVALCLTLSADAPRFIEHAGTVLRHDCAIPALDFDPRGPAIAIRAEHALAMHGLPYPVRQPFP